MLLSLLPAMMFASANALPYPTLWNSAETAVIQSAGAVAPFTIISTRYGSTTFGPSQVQEGTTIAVKGPAGSDVAGTTMYLYWDSVSTAGLLNKTTAGSSGSYDVWFNVPQATYGTHYIWVGDGTVGSPTNSISTPVEVVPYVDLATSSGQPGDSVSMSYYGYNATINMRMVWGTQAEMNAFPAWPTITASPATVAAADSVTTSWTGTLPNTLIQPGSFKVMIGATVYATDNMHGDLVGASGIGGTINYVTGYYDIKISPAPSYGTIMASYNYFDTTNAAVSWLGSGTTNSVGTVTTSETVPSTAAAGTTYAFASFDGYGTFGVSSFTIGPVITVSPLTATTGSFVFILGRGFTTEPAAIWLSESGLAPEMCYIGTSSTASESPIPLAAGRFDVPVIVPQGNNIKDDYTFSVTSDTNTPTSSNTLATVDSFMVSALATVSVTPTFAGTGAKITVAGKNFPKISGMTVEADLYDSTNTKFQAELGTTTLASDGTFSTSFTVPGLQAGPFEIRAYTSPSTNISPDVSFAIGNLLIALSETSGPVGSTLSITGSGFSPNGSYNITLGPETLLSSGSVSSQGVVSSGTMYIPEMAAGTYNLKVTDVTTGIVLTQPFIVTLATKITLSPTTFPTNYNVSIRGDGFKYPGGDTPTFTLFNKTSSGTVTNIWTMVVYSGVNSANPYGPLTVNGTGTFIGWFLAEPGYSYSGGALTAGVKLIPGTYYLNVTDALDSSYYTQAVFTIKPNLVVATPRESTFYIGDTVSFVLQHSQGNITPQYGSTITIYDPSGNVQFKTDALKNWVSVNDYYIEPYASQTEGGNPMVLLADAPLGTWTYKWIGTDSSTIATGSFTVAAAAASTTGVQITALNKTVSSLAGQVSSIASSVNSLSSTVGTISSTVQTVSTTASNAASAAQSASTAASSAATAAQAASTQASAAKTSADQAAAAASSLTTLVYGAIGASLIAALAAIVALMQISRKIA